MVEGNGAISLGASLRALRLGAGQSLEDMARATRISAQYLRALEAEDFPELPAPVFVKGFIRAYCGFLGAPPDEALALYQRSLGGDPSPGPPPTSAPPRASWISHPVVVSGVLMGIFGGGLLALALTVNRAPTPAPDRPDPAPPPAPPAAVQSPAPPLVTPTREAQAAVPQRLVVKAVELTWIRVQTDDGRVVEELLAPGATREWTSETRFLLTVGNAGGLQVQLNGRPLPPLGPPGTVIRGLSLPEPPAGS
jgi:cytoskeletal protein RodZ